MIICKICDKKLKNLYSLTNHLKKHNISNVEYYNKFLKQKYEEYCENELCIDKFENKPRICKCNGLNGYQKCCCSKCSQELLISKKYRVIKSNSMKKRWKDKNSKLNSKERNEKISNSLIGKKFSKERKRNISISHIGQLAWNKGVTLTESHINSLIISHRRTIEEWKELYPTFSKVEEMRYNPDKPGEKEIQVHCKYNECPNFKEQGGWFTPTHDQFVNRIWAIEKKDGNEASYYYCSDECKEKCSLRGKRVSQLIKEDQIRAGIIPEDNYTPSEYNTWREEVFRLDEGLCIYCGQLAEHCHHIEPQKLQPGLALDPANGISVCKECHYKYGHKDECSTGQLANKICK